MIKYAIAILFSLYMSNGISGITVVGTRFIIDNQSQHLNIKVINDNKNDYLIKSELDNKDFIISPPLLFLPKNSSNIVTIVAKEKNHFSEDKLFNLRMTMIPKSTLNHETDSISLAIRNHFRVIHRHTELNKSEFRKIKVINENNKCILNNDSDFVLTISLSKKEKTERERLINIAAHEKIQLESTSSISNCEIWVNFHNDYNDIIEKIKLTA